ncbi:unnamed protein product [Prunus armeniaca]|uniref:Uncharacterized protein n=1 Tax=Prunus armeniaca TaxID=36596 RepID=A0A6J5Y8B1_PRUAR|nr:unnamed protein product [Prunus armeniaca]
MAAVIAVPIARARMKIDHASWIYGFVSIAFRGQIINIKTEFSSLLFETSLEALRKGKPLISPTPFPFIPALSLSPSLSLSLRRRLVKGVTIRNLFRVHVSFASVFLMAFGIYVSICPMLCKCSRQIKFN